MFNKGNEGHKETLEDGLKCLKYDHKETRLICFPCTTQNEKMNCVNPLAFAGATSWSEIAPHGRRHRSTANESGGRRAWPPLPLCLSSPLWTSGEVGRSVGGRATARIGEPSVSEVRSPAPPAQSHGLSVNLENMGADARVLRPSPRPPSARRIIFYRGADYWVDYRVWHSRKPGSGFSTVSAHLFRPVKCQLLWPPWSLSGWMFWLDKWNQLPVELFNLFFFLCYYYARKHLETPDKGGDN